MKRSHPRFVLKVLIAMGLLGVIKSRSSFAVFPPLLPPGQMLFRNAWTAEFEPSYPPS